MENQTQERPRHLPLGENVPGAVKFFRDAILSGKHWYIVLLQAFALWTDDAELYRGQDYRYIIGGEAFDWLLLANRLCESVDGLIPEAEKSALLFQGRPPLELTPDEFKGHLGPLRHQQYLNFFYGVTVEDALVQVTREEVRKERCANGLTYRRNEENEIFQRIYGESEVNLLKQFRKERHYPRSGATSLTEMKEFAYWRFKYRVRTSEKARVASDTHKTLQWLARTGHGYNKLA